MKSSTSIQLLDTQNNNISPITSIESLYFDASYGDNGDYVRYRIYDRVPFLGVSGGILKDTIIDTNNVSEFIVGINAEKTATGPTAGDPSIYRLKYKSMDIDTFNDFVNSKINDKLETYLDTNDVKAGNGISVETSDSYVTVSAKVDGKTIDFDASGNLYSPASSIALSDRVEKLETSVNNLDSSVTDLSTRIGKSENDINSINASIANIDASIAELKSSVATLQKDSAYMLKYVNYMFSGVNNVTSLSNIPVTRQSVYAVLTGTNTQEYLSLANKLEPGQDMNIRVFNTSSTSSIRIILQPSVDSNVDNNNATYNLMSAKAQTLTKNNTCEINIWCYAYGQYSVKYIFKEV